jgi:hypothetical protein
MTDIKQMVAESKLETWITLSHFGNIESGLKKE